MSREEAIDIIRNSMIQIGRCNGKSIFIDAINTLLDTERKTGEWIYVGIWTDMYTADEIPIFKCSVCEDEVMGTNGFDFCPHCGTKMKKREIRNEKQYDF